MSNTEKTNPVVKPEHTERAIAAWNLVAAGAGIESLAKSFASLEATVEARVRLEQTLKAVAWDEACKWVNGLDSKAERTAPELRRGLDGIWEYVSLLGPPCLGAKEEVSDG